MSTLEEWISGLLFAYRTTPHSITTVPLAELMMRRKLKTSLDLARQVLEELAIAGRTGKRKAAMEQRGTEFYKRETPFMLRIIRMEPS